MNATRVSRDWGKKEEENLEKVKGVILCDRLCENRTFCERKKTRDRVKNRLTT